MKKSELIHAISSRTEQLYAPGVSKLATAAVLMALADVIREALAQGEEIQLTNLGKFSIRERGARMGRNPSTGEVVPIAARRVIKFNPAKLLKNTLI